MNKQNNIVRCSGHSYCEQWQSTGHKNSFDSPRIKMSYLAYYCIKL